jgi:hypothetical protein
MNVIDDSAGSAAYYEAKKGTAQARAYRLRETSALLSVAEHKFSAALASGLFSFLFFLILIHF